MTVVTLRVAAPATDLSVHFEPTGMTYELNPGDWFDVTISGPGSGLVEILHGPNSIVVGAWPDASTRVLASDGTELEV
jgi:hypothetical protein